MKEEMTLKEFVENVSKQSSFGSLGVISKLIELEAIDNYLNMMWGVELDIKVKVTEKREGRFYGKSAIEAVDKEAPEKK